MEFDEIEEPEVPVEAETASALLTSCVHTDVDAALRLIDDVPASELRLVLKSFAEVVAMLSFVHSTAGCPDLLGDVRTAIYRAFFEKPDWVD